MFYLGPKDVWRPFVITGLVKSTLNAVENLSFVDSSKRVILTPGHFYRWGLRAPDGAMYMLQPTGTSCCAHFGCTN